MSYVEQVNENRGSANETTVIPPDVFAYALSLKQPEALARRSTPNDLQELPEGTQRFEKARTVGNASVRFALASYLASLHNDGVPFLGHLSEGTREEKLDEFFEDHDGSICFTDTEVARRLFVTKSAMLSGADRWHAIKSYIDVRPDSYIPGQPPTGFGFNDSLYLQAFGRNTYADSELLTEIVEPYQALKSDEKMFERLSMSGFDEGESNRVLANAALKVLDDPDRIVEQMWQWEPAYAVWRDYPDLFAKYRAGIHVLWPTLKAYRTYEVKADSIEVARVRGAYNPIEMAHQDMTIRALGIIAKQGVQADAVSVDVPFDPNSTQAQTRGPREWLVREAATRVHHVITNKVRF